MVPLDWKYKLALLTKLEWKHLPCKPDLWVANFLSSDCIVIRIIDVIVSWDNKLEQGAVGKISKYEALVAIIIDHIMLTYGRLPDIKVVPIVVGARGAIPADWDQRMRDLKLVAEGNKLACSCSRAALKGTQVVHSVWSKQWRIIQNAQEL